VIQVGAMANTLFSSPFYRTHCDQLYLVVQLLTRAYQDSVIMEESDTPWKRATADVLRHAGADMVRAVALLCGGYEHLSRFSMDLHSMAWMEHHDAFGNPI